MPHSPISFGARLTMRKAHAQGGRSRAALADAHECRADAPDLPRFATGISPGSPQAATPIPNRTSRLNAAGSLLGRIREVGGSFIYDGFHPSGTSVLASTLRPISVNSGRNRASDAHATHVAYHRVPSTGFACHQAYISSTIDVSSRNECCPSAWHAPAVDDERGRREL